MSLLCIRRLQLAVLCVLDAVSEARTKESRQGVILSRRSLGGLLQLDALARDARMGWLRAAACTLAPVVAWRGGAARPLCLYVLCWRLVACSQQVVKWHSV